MRIEPLDERHDRSAFTCGVEPLDRYFRTQASQDVRRRVASCFVLVGGDAVPLGYYTLASTSLALADLPSSLAKKLPRYPSVPATLMGRLAVDIRSRGQGYGELLLLDALSRNLRSEIATYALVVDAKDESAATSYQTFAFLPLTAGSRRFFIPMAEAAKLFL